MIDCACKYYCIPEKLFFLCDCLLKFVVVRWNKIKAQTFFWRLVTLVTRLDDDLWHQISHYTKRHSFSLSCSSMKLK